MKWITFEHDGQARVGALLDEQVADLTAAGLAGSMLELIRQGAPSPEQVWAAPRLPLAEARLLAPLPNPPKIAAIGLNYMDHCREQKVNPPQRPMVFAKFPTAVIGPNDPITWDPEVTNQVDYEAELAIVIGRRCRSVSEDEALDYVFGYTVVNDVSARDLQFSDKQWVRAKSLDTFCPIGPVIVSAADIPDPQKLAIRCRVNGQLLQDSSTAEMIFGVRHLVHFLSRAFTLEPGDVIATGTPDGVGVFRDPKIFLKDGDEVIVEVEGIGALRNPVRLNL